MRGPGGPCTGCWPVSFARLGTTERHRAAPTAELMVWAQALVGTEKVWGIPMGTARMQVVLLLASLKSIKI